MGIGNGGTRVTVRSLGLELGVGHGVILPPGYVWAKVRMGGSTCYLSAR